MKKSNLIDTLKSCSWILIPVLLVFSMAGTILINNGTQNLFAYQAEAFLEGKINIQGDVNSLPGETIQRNGNTYIPFPPFPAILLVPFVALFGISGVKVTLLSAVIASVSCYLLYRILKKLNIDPALIFWIMAAFGLGTAYWQTLRASMWVWMFAQIVSVLFMFLSINEVLGEGRGILAGLFLGLAFLSRQLSIYAGIFIIAILWERQTTIKKLANIFGFLLGIGACLAIYLIFNYLRFGSFDTGYAIINITGFGRERVNQYGLFNPAYLFFNVVYMFLQGFHLEFGGVDKLQITAIDPFGTSLLSASPFIIAVFRAKWNRIIQWGAWLSIGLSLLQMLLYHNNGYIQYNAQRFTLDFMPILILLTALGFENSSNDLVSILKGAVIYAVILNVVVLVLLGR